MATSPKSAPARSLVQLMWFVVIMFSVLATVKPLEAAVSVVQGGGIAIELRDNVRVGIGTWKRYGHIAQDIRDSNIAYSEETVGRIHEAYMQHQITPENYVRLREIGHQLNDAAQREYTERRNLNQRMKTNARKSEIISRIPIIRWAKKGWVYTDEKADEAIQNSRAIQSQVALVAQLKDKLGKGLQKKDKPTFITVPSWGWEVPEGDNVSYAATCIFIDKGNKLEIGRRKLGASNPEDLLKILKELACDKPDRVYIKQFVLEAFRKGDTSPFFTKTGSTR